jgi:putative oxidoreductase
MTSFASQAPSGRFAGIAQTLLRVFAAGIFMQHGAQKLLGAFADPAMHGGGHGLPTRVLIAGIIELVGGGCILTGLFIRVVAFIASGEMAVAYFTVHFPRGFWPIENKGELAVALCFIFLFFAAAGAGPYSLDAVIASRRHGRVDPT